MTFNPDRLVLARTRRGMTQTRLAGVCHVNAKSVRRYESGDQTPSDARLDAMAAALQFPRGFFFRSDPPPVLPSSAASFRSLSTMTQQQAQAALGAGAIAIELSDVLDRRLKLPARNLPDLRGLEPERGANELRAAWNLGNAPIPNVVHLLELHGVRVFSLVADCETVDAFCVFRAGTPFVFLSTGKSAERSRLDAGHELGHLVLHEGLPSRGQATEREANRFAAAFLMPRDDVLAHAPRVANVETVVHAKRRWGVSAVALARRLYDVGLMREFHYKQLCIEMSRLGFRKAEPEPMQREQSQLLRKAFEVLRQHGISRSDVANELNITTEELDRHVFGLVMVAVSGDGRTSRNVRPALRVVK